MLFTTTVLLRKVVWTPELPWNLERENPRQLFGAFSRVHLLEWRFWSLARMLGGRGKRGRPSGGWSNAPLLI